MKNTNINRLATHVLIMLVIAVATLTTVALPATANDGGTTTLSGYVTRNPSIRYNSTGGINTITATGAGRFLVRFPGWAAPGGVVLVTPYSNSGDLTCQAQYWAPSGLDEIVSVSCANRSGPVDNANFSVLFSRPAWGTTGPYGYLWADIPTGGCYTPNLRYQFNSAGRENTVCRTATGQWNVTLPGLGPWTAAEGGGDIQVNAYGGTTARCGIVNWYTDSSNALQATVTCTTPSGAPVDTYFTLLYTNAVSLLGHNRFVPPDGDLGAGYLWAYQPSTPGTYTPTGYSWNASGATNTITRLEVGQYQAYFPNIIVLGGISQVTTYRSTTTLHRR
jgi:hypothetical protein